MHIIQEKWSDILNMIKIEHDVSDVSFNAWLEPLEVYKVEGNVVTIIVTNGSMALDYINKKYLLPLKVSIAERMLCGRYTVQKIYTQLCRHWNS